MQREQITTGGQKNQIGREPAGCAKGKLLLEAISRNSAQLHLELGIQTLELPGLLLQQSLQPALLDRIGLGRQLHHHIDAVSNRRQALNPKGPTG
jgi:hypothetical protein